MHDILKVGGVLVSLSRQQFLDNAQHIKDKGHRAFPEGRWGAHLPLYG